MLVKGKHYRTVWFREGKLYMIEQNKLPFMFEIVEFSSYTEVCTAIKVMTVRGAGAIGATAGFAMAMAASQAPTLETEYQKYIQRAKTEIEATRPTARNLFYATQKVYEAARISPSKAIEMAQAIADEDATACKKIGEHGNQLISSKMNILTHCNAGWLAFVDYGSALSPIYEAKRTGKDIFVYADETRPRNQGARLTAWELFNENIPHTIIPDSAGAFYMSKRKIDIIITGADRIAQNGDTANKIGTFEKAVIAKHFGIPFYIAAPLSTIDVSCPKGNDIIIEERTAMEVTHITGIDEKGELKEIQISSPGSSALNPAFDVKI
ncbi:MAG: S-methyl-5-thioribose-1-phosphate isomerase [Bacteroidales bacterium]